MYVREAFQQRQPLLAAGIGITGGVLLVLIATARSPLIAALALLGLFGVAVIFLSPSIAFLLTTAVVPLERIGRFSADTDMYTFSLMRLLGSLTLCSFLLHAAVRKWKLKFGYAFLLYAAYVVIGLGTLLYTTDRLGTVRAAGAILGNLLFFFLIINIVRDFELAKRAVVVWLCVTVAIGIFTAYQWHTGRGAGELDLGSTSQRFTTVLQDTSEWEDLSDIDRAAGPTSHAAVYGINLILTLPFFAFLIRSQRDWRIRTLAALGGLIVVYNIFLSNTRAALLLAAVVMLSCVLSGMLRLRPVTLLALVLLGSMTAAFIPAAVYRRALDIDNYTYKQSGTLRIRFQLWEAGWKVATSHWLTGVGIGNQVAVPKMVKEPTPERISVHNEYLETLLEVGVFGALLFFSFAGFLVWCAARAKKLFGRLSGFREQYWFMLACQLAMIAVLLYGFQVDVFHFPLKGWWLIAGLTRVLYSIARREYALASHALEVAS